MKISRKLANCMIINGFLLENDINNEPIVKSAADRFCEWAQEHRLRGRDESFACFERGKIYSGGPRWKRMPNFGKRTLDEALSLCGSVAKQQTRKAFGYNVSVHL